MKWIGLTGCMGCGKSTVAQILRQDHDLEVISADDVALEILKTDQELQDYISKNLNVGFDPDFSLYRSKISAKVFGNPEALKKYEQIFHPKVKQYVAGLKEKLSKNQDLAFYDIPLLFEKNMQSDFSAIIGVFADHDVQMARLKERNQWTDDQIAERLKHQIPNKTKIDQCDFIIFNNSSLDSLKTQIIDILAKLVSH